MSEIAERLCAALPAEPISVADVLAVKKKAYPDIDPMLGLQPSPTENVIVLHVTDAPEVSYLGVEEHGWEILKTVDVQDAPSEEAPWREAAKTSMEWAETYYSSETFAVLQKGN